MEKLCKRNCRTSHRNLLRHTFCTNMANREITSNNLRYGMGHKNVTMTLGYYAHRSYQSAQAEMQRLMV
ncbi:tyrosine-type recombinase/integrase [Anaeromassilibacillus sp. SJQ-1]|uniref:tyrosine-type recombinase/integrase n=1 Tax=unclassified Anaeromassilibacillus TaxID=2625359 RepID=UPI003988E803